METKNKKKYIYLYEGEENYIDVNDPIAKKVNQLDLIIKKYLKLEKSNRYKKSSKHIYEINGFIFYLKKIGPASKNNDGEKKNHLRIIKKNLPETNLDFIVGYYFTGDEVILSIINSYYFYNEGNDKEFIISFNLDDIKKAINKKYHLAKNVRKYGNESILIDKIVVLTNNKNFFDVLKDINSPKFKNTISLKDKVQNSSKKNKSLNNTNKDIPKKEKQDKPITLHETTIVKLQDEKKFSSKERDSKFVKDAKKWFFENDTMGKCEDCDYSFLKEHNKEFIELHHKKLHSDTGDIKKVYKNLTEVKEDFSFLCPNCHRIKHLFDNLTKQK